MWSQQHNTIKSNICNFWLSKNWMPDHWKGSVNTLFCTLPAHDQLHLWIMINCICELQQLGTTLQCLLSSTWYDKISCLRPFFFIFAYFNQWSRRKAWESIFERVVCEMFRMLLGYNIWEYSYGTYGSLIPRLSHHPVFTNKNWMVGRPGNEAAIQITGQCCINCVAWQVFKYLHTQGD